MNEPIEIGFIETDRQLHAARFSPCGRFLLGGDHEGAVRRWRLPEEAESGGDDPPADAKKRGPAALPLEELPPLSGHSAWVQPLAFHPAGELLYTADSWGTICAWKYADENAAPIWRIEAAHDGWVRDLSVSPDGKILASCGRDQAVRLWSTADGSQSGELAGLGEDVFSICFHPGGGYVVSGDLKGRVKVWDVKREECVRELDAATLYLYDRLQDVGGVWKLAFDDEGKSLAVAGGVPSRGATVQAVPTVLLFDFESGEPTRALSLGEQKDCYVHDCLLSGGVLFAVTSGTPGNGQLLLMRPGEDAPFYKTTHMANCHSVDLSPDGRRLAVVATNKGSNGNGRPLKDGEYRGNNSPIHLFAIGADSAG